VRRRRGRPQSLDQNRLTALYCRALDALKRRGCRRPVNDCETCADDTYPTGPRGTGTPAPDVADSCGPGLATRYEWSATRETYPAACSSKMVQFAPFSPRVTQDETQGFCGNHKKSRYDVAISPRRHLLRGQVCRISNVRYYHRGAAGRRTRCKRGCGRGARASTWASCSG